MSLRTPCIPFNPLGFGMWILTVIPIIILFPVSFYGLRESLKLKQASLKYFYWITSFLLLISSILWSTHFFFDFDISRYCAHPTRIMVTNYVSLTAYLFSLISICCLYTIRLYLSFKSTKYSVATPIFVVFALMLFIQFLSTLPQLYFNISARRAVAEHNTQEAAKWTRLLFLTFNIFGSVNMLYNIVLLIIFARQIYKMVSYLKDDNKRSEYIREIVKPVAYYAICLLVVLLSTTIVFMFTFVRGNLIVDTNLIYQTNMAVVAWDILINDMSIHLQFDASRNIMDLCCKCLVRIFVQKMIGDRDYVFPLDTMDTDTDGISRLRVNSDSHVLEEDMEATSLTNRYTTTGDTTDDTTSTARTPLHLQRAITKFGGVPSWIVA